MGIGQKFSNLVEALAQGTSYEGVWRKNREVQITDEAADKANRIVGMHELQVGQTVQLGRLTIERGTGKDETGQRSLGDGHVKVYLDNCLVLNHCYNTSIRQFAPDFDNWVPVLDQTYATERLKHSRVSAQSRYLP